MPVDFPRANELIEGRRCLDGTDGEAARVAAVEQLTTDERDWIRRVAEGRQPVANARVRANAVSVLGYERPASAATIAVLAALVDDPDTDVALRAIRAGHADPTIESKLVALLSGPDLVRALAAARHLATPGRTDLAPSLRTLRDRFARASPGTKVSQHTLDRLIATIQQ